MSNRSTISESVANACTESAGTVQALAEEVGVSYAALCSWSRGRRRPPAHRLLKLAEVMDSRAERLRELAIELRQQAAQGTVAPAADDRSASPQLRVEPVRDGGMNEPAGSRMPLAAAGRGNAAGTPAYLSSSLAESRSRRSSSAIPLPPPAPRR
jgi:transcriptional regulator with XRE-family HTH domain